MAIYSRSSIQNINNRVSGSGKTNALLNLINNHPDIDKIYLYTKDPYEAKCQYLINRSEKVGLNYCDDPKVFIEYSNDIQDVYKNMDEYNIDKERKILIVFDDMIADMINNKKPNSIVTDLFIRGRKYTAESYSFLVNDAMLASDNPLRFRKNLFNI